MILKIDNDVIGLDGNCVSGGVVGTQIHDQEVTARDGECGGDGIDGDVGARREWKCAKGQERRGKINEKSGAG